MASIVEIISETVAEKKLNGPGTPADEMAYSRLKLPELSNLIKIDKNANKIFWPVVTQFFILLRICLAQGVATLYCHGFKSHNIYLMLSRICWAEHGVC